MDEAFFIASKTVGALARVESWLVIGLILALVAVWRGRRRGALMWLGAVLAVVLGLTVFPLGNGMVAALESGYPAAPALAKVDGIIVLGGAEDLGPYARWGGLEMNEAGERLVAGVELARRFPDAKLIYTGGTAGLLGNPDPGAPSRMVKDFWLDMGVPEQQIALEGMSRTTYENAVLTKAALQPQPGQSYVLVTSAWHMPRSMEAFTRAGWTGLTAWPVDFRSTRRTFRAGWRLDEHLVDANLALKEFVGRMAYYLAGESMKLLVFGKTGQVAQDLARRLPSDCVATFLSRAEADLMHPESCGAAVLQGAYDAVINAAAWTAVDKAEAEEAAATVVNAAAPGEMAKACAAKGIPFLTISTDYVFDGSGDVPFRPGDATGPLGAYGRSKLAGEQAVLAAGGRSLILRTSWVISAHGANFVKTMLRLGAEREVLRVVADQVGGPTPAPAIADALLTCARAMTGGAAGGVHHFAGAPDTSWAEFARAIMARAHLPCRIEDIPTEAYPTPARRPKNSRLDCADLERAFGISRPDWRSGLDLILKELEA